jgi:protease-4
MDALNHAWTEEEIDAMQGFIDTIYNKFLQIASTSRGIPVDTLKTLAGGRVWSGEQAKANQLVDQLGGLDDALSMVAKGAKLDKYKVVHRPEASTGLDLGQLLGGQEDEIDIATSALWNDSSSAMSSDKIVAILENRLLALLKEHGFRGDATRLLLRSIDWTGKEPPKAWALLGEELKISQ